ncbi:hypothetical protein [Pseudorhodoferax aquiterrae]|uniref:hypothetical protein n=1 Tax=Pseudorhodoferax aquiterrae TaxID=747304 RepID=UPI0016779CB0|nr:hypothetical protein [Pseudorhodoferax aquiterrae]
MFGSSWVMVTDAKSHQRSQRIRADLKKVLDVPMKAPNFTRQQGCALAVWALSSRP